MFVDHSLRAYGCKVWFGQGLTNYFRRFVQGYANLEGSLANLLRKYAPCVWLSQLADSTAPCHRVRISTAAYELQLPH